MLKEEIMIKLIEEIMMIEEYIEMMFLIEDMLEMNKLIEDKSEMIKLIEVFKEMIECKEMIFKDLTLNIELISPDTIIENNLDS